MRLPCVAAAFLSCRARCCVRDAHVPSARMPSGVVPHVSLTALSLPTKSGGPPHSRSCLALHCELMPLLLMLLHAAPVCPRAHARLPCWVRAPSRVPSTGSSTRLADHRSSPRAARRFGWSCTNRNEPSPRLQQRAAPPAKRSSPGCACARPVPTCDTLYMRL